MTDPTGISSAEAPGGPQDAPDAPAAPSSTDAPAAAEPEQPESDDVAALRSEAASRRRSLRQVEAERDALRERVDAHDRASAERIAGRRMAEGADLWVVTNLGELRDDDGELDPDRVKVAVDDVLTRRPHWRKPAEPSPDLHPGARPVVEEGPSFGAAIRKAAGKRASDTPPFAA